ncbi:MAG: Slp family lipoprotein [Deltaproteobacteria bacterium]|nr:Slp family lipoprotein [Deltaproteobacteria bacterium]
MLNKKTVLLLLVLLIVSGCAPVIDKKTLESVDREIRFADLVKDPDRYRGRKVLLGGTIVGVENREGKTEIEVLDQPLNYQLRPTNPEESEGRFLCVFEGFKDPAIYSRNRHITIAGVFKGLEKRRLGEMDYRYPVIEPVEHYLWRSPYGEPSVGIGVGIGIGF